ncbi:MAG TPA: very short patch repair endonuclease [Thermoanaerobaculia bacterium]|nr:very short patch repair endonuclease [Thermoanaerobaculia bacterium]
MSPEGRVPSYKGRRPASERASAAARGASRKSDTRCEILLRQALWRAGCRYRKDVAELPGRPDIVFPGARLIVFCDGDFWHGKDWRARRRKLARGTNGSYWLAKIERNIERDRRHRALLEGRGWTVFRFWESDIHAGTKEIVRRILLALDDRGHHRTHLDKRRQGA